MPASHGAQIAIGRSQYQTGFDISPMVARRDDVTLDLLRTCDREKPTPQVGFLRALGLVVDLAGRGRLSARCGRC